jgi:GNAT superfamily N-acetyltransferase
MSGRQRATLDRPCAADRNVVSLFFDLGFGRYVIDAYRGVAAVPGAAVRVCTIRRAEPSAFAEVRALMDMAMDFYLEAPPFLRQTPNTDADILSLLEQENCAVFLADVGGSAVGVMNVRTDTEADPFSLADSQTARLDPLGAYIRPEYRSRGIGDALLAECVSWAREHGATLVHVDYEGANLYASSY